jgi:hypothetical protein
MVDPDEHRPVGILRDHRLWLLTLLGATAGAVYGLWFGPSIGESPLVGAVALGILGLAPGFVTGLLIAGLRRRSVAQTVAESERIRFVDSLNERAQPGSRYSISPGDRRALVMDLSKAHDAGLTPEIQARLRQKIGQLLEADIVGAAADLRRHGFERWIVQLNGTTILERPVSGVRSG